jgi:leader peptidase (prepilin peptidase)/N-methyltransferase
VTDDWRIFLMPPSQLPPMVAAIVLAWTFFVGACLGSFLNVVIARVPKGLSVVRPRSRCPKCEKQISGFDNIPVASWFILGGKCRNCKTPISFRYPFIEILMGVAGMAAAARFGVGLYALELFTFTALLTAIAFVDLDTWTVPQPLFLSLIIGGLAFAGIHAITLDEGGRDVLVQRLIGAVAAGVLLSAIVVLSTGILRRVGTRIENGVEVRGRVGPNDYAMGWGDPLILVGVGAFLGWRLLPFVVFLASVQGSIVGIALILVSKVRPGGPGLPQGDKPVSDDDDWVPPKNAVPFGPFLALGAMEAAFFGDALLARFMPLFGVFAE